MLEAQTGEQKGLKTGKARAEGESSQGKESRYPERGKLKWIRNQADTAHLVSTASLLVPAIYMGSL